MAAKKYTAAEDIYDIEGKIIALAGEDVTAKQLGKSLPWLLEQGRVTESGGE